MSVKLDRLNEQVMIEISNIINNNVKYVDIGFVTITAVKITSDLSYAKVYFTTLDDNKKEVCDKLNKVSSYIRSELCNRIEVRKMPELKFVFDESIDYGKKIESIIEDIHNE